MKPLNISIVAVAASLAAAPLVAQTTDVDDSASANAEALTAGQPMMADERIYSADGQLYAVYDLNEGTWTVYEGATETEVETMSDADFAARSDFEVTRISEGQIGAEPRDPAEDIASPEGNVVTLTDDGSGEAEVSTLSDGEIGAEVSDPGTEMATTAAPASTEMPMLKAGTAEMRYYNAERTTYAVHDREAGLWTIHDAASHEPIETTRNYTPYEAGYTVILPGQDDMIGMSSEAGSIGMESEDASMGMETGVEAEGGSMNMETEAGSMGMETDATDSEGETSN